MRARYLLPGLLVIASAAQAQTATLTVKDGRALVLGGETDLGGMLTPTDLDAVTLVDAFDQLCLPDPGGAAARVAGSPFEVQPSEAVLLAEGKHPEARIPVLVGPTTVVTIWNGDDTGWKGRPIAMPSRAGVTTGPYGPFKAFGTQCNLVVKVADFTAAKAAIEALSAKYGAAGKLVVKNTFADGYWQVGDMRVKVNVPTRRSGPQPLHISVQAFPPKGK